MDVRRVHEHLGTDASGSGAAMDHWWPPIYDIDSDATVLVTNGAVWAYDLQADTWTAKRAAPTGNKALWAYDPLYDLIVATDYSNPANLWNYDVDADAWTPIHQANLPGDASPLREGGGAGLTHWARLRSSADDECLLPSGRPGLHPRRQRGGR